MGKTLNDLHLSDQPLRSAQPIDPRETAWYQLAQEIDSMLGSMDYDWAEGTLSDIKETIERTQHVSVGQRNAVENIANARRSRERSRRYEGFGGRRW
jgi:hypothetical protein